MLPLSLLRTAQNHPMLVELKNGETYNGHLDGDKFWRMPECYIRGSTIKYLRIPDEVIDMVKEDVQMKSRVRGEMRGHRGGQSQRGSRGSGRGTFGGRGGRGAVSIGKGVSNKGGKLKN
ncbi:U6 snRNA-associated Sm-like protein LSm4 isoform X2 [Copidosoma floridanum]|uniref:U6 snRNA-associated Sm-like protein LSm4 isoform X2 n=1 Tax=Copidosoma floridanum TaxID=29053 RepID=UPI0006C9D055|nr:U6 snRNA-associated Sm-like protein LSm4 isoform X2 [Copidosoma floridanum]